ncbi:hypothetical protein NDU88_006056 [Pleurodeles waltl]|uniref:Uncharacterized protein n=1 Tax=Pleurodeles waltl TaxID=8319 RepID=A0AAV7NYA1_PLEWA|nr:hypothetical protein NDU88_006056 [Pleurodeles waltl]
MLRSLVWPQAVAPTRSAAQGQANFVVTHLRFSCVLRSGGGSQGDHLTSRPFPCRCPASRIPHMGQLRQGKPQSVGSPSPASPISGTLPEEGFFVRGRPRSEARPTAITGRGCPPSPSSNTTPRSPGKGACLGGPAQPARSSHRGSAPPGPAHPRGPLNIVLRWSQGSRREPRRPRAAAKGSAPLQTRRQSGTASVPRISLRGPCHLRPPPVGSAGVRRWLGRAHGARSASLSYGRTKRRCAPLFLELTLATMLVAAAR